MDILEIILLPILAAILLVGYFKVFRRFYSAEPNEWMLVMRNGKVIECGIGISYYASLFDVVVKFPSQINKVRFQAQQVTQEVQGLEVSGIIIWSVFRDNEGPLKAFKYLGEDIKTNDPATANDKIVEIANSIVRHRVANSTIDEVLKNREMVREEIKKEMNEIVNGWGVWLESVEITDVKILSSTLFKDLQMEFRKEQQQKAEYIKMETEKDLRERRLAQDIEYAKKEAENESNKTIYSLTESIKISKERQKVFLEQQKIERKKIETDNKLKEFKENQQKEFKLFEKQRKFEKDSIQLEQALIKKKKEFEAEKEDQKTSRFLLLKDLDKINVNKDAELDTEKKNLSQKNKFLLEMDPKIRALDAISMIYSHLPVHEIKLFNHGESKDPAAILVNQIMGTVQGLSNSAK